MSAPSKQAPKLKLYTSRARWFHLLTAPADYRHEAACYASIAKRACKGKRETMLELGSGGGNNAFHLKNHFRLTLTDVAKEMLALSRTINPECEHICGDMRTLRLRRRFDIVFAHDAVSYMTDMRDLEAAMRTAFVHCRPGGIALFAPDDFRETFRSTTQHGGHDAGDRGLRFVEWSYDPNPADTHYVAEYAYLMRNGDTVRVEHDRHLNGLFLRVQWRAALLRTGFEKIRMTRPRGCSNVIVAMRPKR